MQDIILNFSEPETEEEGVSDESEPTEVEGGESSSDESASSEM